MSHAFSVEIVKNKMFNKFVVTVSFITCNTHRFFL